MRRAWLPLVLALVAPALARAETIYAIQAGTGGGVHNWLLRFDSATPSTLEFAIPVTGDLGYGGSLPYLEFDPQTGALYAFEAVNCEILCPAPGPPARPAQIDPLTGQSWFLDWPDWPGFLEYAADWSKVDIHPVTREMRLSLNPNRNLRYALDSLAAIEDAPFDVSEHIRAFAHTWPDESGGVETYAILDATPKGLQLARIGGPGGTPPASSGEVTLIGPVSLVGYLEGFDISPGGTAYVSTFEYSSGPGPEYTSRLFTIDLATANVQELGVIAGMVSPVWVSGIAVAPEGPGVLAVPTVSPVGLAVLALVLGIAGFSRLAPKGRQTGG